jgi:hypothetical protein
MNIKTYRHEIDIQKQQHYEEKASNTCKIFAKLKHLHIPFVNGNGLTKVLIKWLGSNLEQDEVFEDDFIAYDALGMCNQELHMLNQQNAYYFQIFRLGGLQYKIMFCSCDD